METQHTPTGHWKRAIAHVDMNAFFAAIEKRDFPELRNQPVAVTNGEVGSCIITSCYNARAYGIRTGMRMREARLRCPDLVQRPARPKVYAQTSTAIMDALASVCPDMEIFSVDEAFIDMTAYQRLYGSPVEIARRLKAVVYEASGLFCSVGVSGDKTTAKYAAKQNKPNGFTVILPWEAEEALKYVPVTDLCGIAKGIGNFLAERGVVVCGQMKRLPIGVLAKRFGNLGRRIWYMAQGADPEPMHYEVPAPKTIGHGKVMPPDTRSKDLIQVYLLHMSFKVCARMRRHGFAAKKFFIGLKTREGWLGTKAQMAFVTTDSDALYQCCCKVLDTCWQGEGVHQVQVTALDPAPEQLTPDLFDETEVASDRKQNLFQAVDEVNARYGELTLAPAMLLKRSKMPNVIAPAWKPAGHRQSV